MTAEVLIPDDPRGGAVFSACGRYRTLLWRHWGDLKGSHACFLMCNPSKANAIALDPTIRRCARFARELEFSGLTVVNLFALRSTDPFGLLRVENPVGEGNDESIVLAAAAARMVICAWGLAGSAALRRLVEARAREVYALIEERPLHALATTREGWPRHPLYLPAASRPVPWRLP